MNPFYFLEARALITFKSFQILSFRLIIITATKYKEVSNNETFTLKFVKTINLKMLHIG